MKPSTYPNEAFTRSVHEDALQAAGAAPTPAETTIECNRLQDWNQLNREIKFDLLEYIYCKFKPGITEARHWTSYGLKHMYEVVNTYVTNGQFKAAMLLSGYLPVHPEYLNWTFQISPVFRCIKNATRGIETMKLGSSRRLTEQYRCSDQGQKLIARLEALADFNFPEQ